MRVNRNSGWPLSMALAAFLAVAAGPARAQIIDSVPTDTPNSRPTDTVFVPNSNNFFFVEEAANQIGWINWDFGDVREFRLSLPGSQPTSIDVDSNGIVWFCMAGTNRIGAYNPAANYLVQYYWGGSGLGLAGIACDRSGGVWFTEQNTHRIGRLDSTRLTLKYFQWTTELVGPIGIDCDSMGRAWFTEYRAHRIGMCDPYWNYVYDWYWTGYNSGPWGIVVDADDDVWFTERNTGTISVLDSSSGFTFDFNTFGGFSSQPSYIDAHQNSQNQTVVAWAETGSGKVGVLNSFTGQQTQIQATSPSAAPTGVSFIDTGLGFTETNTGLINGVYFEFGSSTYGTYVQRQPGEPGPKLASLSLGRPAFTQTLAVRTAAGTVDDSQIILIKKEGKIKGNKGQKKAKSKRTDAKTQTIAQLAKEEDRPQVKNRKFQTRKPNRGQGRGNRA